MNLKDALGFVRRTAQSTPVAPAPPASTAARITGALAVPATGRVVRSGVAAGATALALSAASALTSRVRRRMEGS